MTNQTDPKDDSTRRPDPREVERRLFAGLMRTKPLPIVPDQEATNHAPAASRRKPA